MINILVFVGILLSGSKGYTTQELGAMAASQFVIFTSQEDFPNFEAVHKRALGHFKHAAPTELRAELEPVVKRFGMRSKEGCGAAYVMALHGVDVRKNVERLRRAFAGPADEIFYLAVPEALADIYLRRGEKSALKALVEAKTDGGGAELQCDQVCRVFAARPVEVVRMVLESKADWKTLAGELAQGPADWDDEPADAHKPVDDPVERGFAKLEKASDPAIRAAGKRLEKAVDADDEAG